MDIINILIQSVFYLFNVLLTIIITIKQLLKRLENNVIIVYAIVRFWSRSYDGRMDSLFAIMISMLPFLIRILNFLSENVWIIPLFFPMYYTINSFFYA